MSMILTFYLQFHGQLTFNHSVFSVCRKPFLNSFILGNPAGYCFPSDKLLMLATVVLLVHS